MTRAVLIVDDSRAVRDMISFTLEPQGYSVVAAENGAEGLDKFRSQKLDLVITDLNMPVMNGLEFIREARGAAVNQGVPIVMLSTETRPELKAEGKAAGATGWIDKPFDADMLAAVARKLAG